MIRYIKKFFPWFLKIPLKILMCKIPYKERILRGLMFRWGDMDIPSEAYNVYKSHLDVAVKYISFLPKTVLELGPGDSLNSAIFFYFVGYEKVYLLDNGDYAIKNMEVYYNFIDYLNKNATQIQMNPINHLKECRTVDELLALTNSVYLTNGMADLKHLPDNSVDYIFSNNVLEHIYKREFTDEISELYRINNGIASHTIDYKDHLQESLYSLKFAEKTWESPLVKEAGFYTNRLRHYEVLDVFRTNGYSVIEDNIILFPEPQKVKELKVDAAFSERDDLMIATSHVVLKKAKK